MSVEAVNNIATGSDEPRHGAGIFAGSHHFTLAGGTFTNSTTTYVAAPTVPPDFRMIPWGDIDLQRELLANEDSDVISYQSERNCVRRVYSAKVDGRNSGVTVAVYLGDRAEEDWRRDVATYMSIRHPNIVQICAGASYGNVHATVLHGDLVPLKQFTAGYSTIVEAYLYAVFANEWRKTRDFLHLAFQRYLNSSECTMWIRPSIGQLSADLVPPDRNDKVTFFSSEFASDIQAPAIPSAFDPRNSEVITSESFSLEVYHRICAFHLVNFHYKDISSASFTVGAVVFWSTLGQTHERDGTEIASLREFHIKYEDWSPSGNLRSLGEMMENGWTRHDAKSFNTDITLIVNTCGRRESWLSQANSIFGSLHIGSNLENYALVDQVYFTLRINRTVDLDCPNDSPAYWSLDPLGHECLTVEEALRLGFPSLWRTTEVYSYSWDTSIYAGLRRFHQAKGFDPDSQDVAQHLGYPLYRLSKDVNPPFAHVAEYERESWGNFKDDEDWDDGETDGASANEGDEMKTEGMEEEAKSASGAEEQSHCDSLSVEFSNHGGQQSSESLLVVIGGPGIQSPEYASSQPMLHHAEEDIPVTLKILANIQLTLILFLATCWMYDNVQ